MLLAVETERDLGLLDSGVAVAVFVRRLEQFDADLPWVDAGVYERPVDRVDESGRAA